MASRAQRSEAASSAYVDRLVAVFGHADRVVPLRDYRFGLMPLDRKSVAPSSRPRLESRPSIGP